MKNTTKKITIITAPNTSRHNKTGSWRTEKPMTDNNICIGCSRCAKICPEGCITMVAGTAVDTAATDALKPVTDYDYCKGCALCATECPVKAIKMIKDYE